MADIKAIHHICIETADIERSLGYYCNILGFELVGREQCDFGEYAMLKNGLARIELIQSANKRAVIKGNAPIAHIGFEVEDVKALFDELRVKGVRFKTEDIEVHSEPMGGFVSCSTVGPDGEDINFYKFKRSF